MSLLRVLAVNATVCLSVLLLFSVLQTTYTDYLHMPDGVQLLTTTLRPWTPVVGLPLPLPNIHPPKCEREVPAVFSQMEKDVPIVGNSSINKYMNVIEVCCKGYKRYPYDWSRCVPDCRDKCQRNGFCMEGGVCECFDEFVLNHRNDCISTCPLGCPNGRCFLNGTCLCNYGYQLDAAKKYCEPYCYFGCGRNAFCAEPHKCECLEGYAKSREPDGIMGCQPVCIPDCGYGRCVGPNQCECFLGYVKRENRSICESNCYKKCENGLCVNSTTCVCENGYNYDFNTTTCLPDCGEDCENGVCISPGKCRCFSGYYPVGNKCEAICERGCGFYGKCIAPNVCGCAIVDGPLRTYQYCGKGSCTSVGRCRCDPGTTRFLNQCLSPDKVTTYATQRHLKINETFIEEFNMLIGTYFMLRGEFGRYPFWTGF